MLSLGKSDKQIANVLDIGLRTVELEKNRVAKGLGLHTSQLLIWTVENRAALGESVRNSDQDSGDNTNVVDDVRESVLHAGIVGIWPHQLAEHVSSALNWSI